MVHTSAFQKNPYLIGRPVNTQDLFFGRKLLLEEIRDILKQGKKVILLDGNRRIGKSSLLKQIPKFVNLEEFVFVSVDLEYQYQKPLSKVLKSLATNIIAELKPDINQITPPTAADLESDLSIFTEIFLRQVYQMLGKKKLVLLLDEFQESRKSDTESLIVTFFPYLRYLLSLQDNKLSIIVCSGRQSSDLSSLRSIFEAAFTQTIGLLNEDETKELITKPAEGVLKYDQDAIQEIFKLSAGHPYFTQIICFNIFGQARNKENPNINRQDVENIVEKSIESAEGGLSWLWDGLSIPEQVIFAAVAEFEKQLQKSSFDQNKAIVKDVFTLLKNNGVIETKTLRKAFDQLGKRGLLDDNKRGVKVKLIQMWLLKRHPIYQEIAKLQDVEQLENNENNIEENNNIENKYEAAKRLEQENNKETLKLYQDILQINPNHLGSILGIAAIYLELENFDDAIELYERAYQIDPLRHKEKLLQALETYAHYFMIKKNLNAAKEQYEKVLEIDNDRILAQIKLKELEVDIAESRQVNLVHLPPENAPSKRQNRNLQKNKLLVVSIGGFTLTIALMSWLLYRAYIPCLPGQSKEFGIVCAAHKINLISRGERTLFPTILNPHRDQGITAYKDNNYLKATQFFKSAVEYNRNDPEVLIYYNNALARSKGTPMNLAVVVPVDNAANQAREILRGVAQAQNQFNNNNGLNGRLLEIVIANDGNYDKDKQGETAKQVAEELVKDSNILGVVGHNSSDSTLAALPLYEEGKLPVISPGSTSIYISNKIFFRTVPTDAASGEKLAEYAIKSGLKKVLIFANTDSKYSSNSLRESFEKKFEKQGGEIINSKPIELNNNPQLDGGNAVSISIFQYNAQAAALFPDENLIPQALNIARQIGTIPNFQQRGLKILGGSSLYSNDVLTQGKKDVEGMVLAVSWFRESPQSRKFAQAAAQQWEGQVGWRTATSFDATVAFLEAIKAASGNLTRETVLQELRKVNLSDSKTSGEPLKFTSDGERQTEPVLIQVKGGKFTIIP